MSRPIRIQYPGAVYHVMSRGDGGQKIFKDDIDYENFLNVFVDMLDRYNCICLAYCLMPNHYHLLIETPDPNLSIAMRQLNGRYTRTFNIRHKRFGHVFQGRFKSILVDMEEYRYEIIRYIALNPVRSKLVKKPSQWRWSSHNEMMGRTKRPSHCLDIKKALRLFGNNTKQARQNYLENINLKITDNDAVEQIEKKTILGSMEFVEKIKGYFEKQSHVIEIPKIERFAHRPKLETLFMKGESKKSRNDKLKKANLEYGYSLSEIGRAAGLHYATVSRIVNDKYKYSNKKMS